MKAPITASQAMQHPTVVETINTLSQLADKLRVERDALLDRLEKAEKDAERLDYLQTGVTVELLWYTTIPEFRIGGRLFASDSDIRTAIDAEMEASK